MPAGSKEDDAVLTPRAAAAGGRVAERLRRTSRQTQLFQFSIGKEAERLPVRGPEGKARAFGVGQAGRILRSRFIDPERVISVGVAMPDNRYSVAVGRHRYISRDEGEGAEKNLSRRELSTRATKERNAISSRASPPAMSPGGQFAPVRPVFPWTGEPVPALRDPLQLQPNVMRGLVAVVRILRQTVVISVFESRRRERLRP